MLRKYLNQFKFKHWNKHRFEKEVIDDHDLSIHTVLEEEEEKELVFEGYKVCEKDLKQASQ